MDYPSLLIFTLKDVFKENVSEYYTVRSFLGDWPHEKICQILCEDFNSGPRGMVSPNVYRIGHEDVMIGSWLFKGKREVKTVMREQHVKESQKSSVLKSVILSLRRLIVDLYGFLPYRRNKELDLFIKEFKPDFIYCNASSPRMFRLCEQYSKKLNVPFVPHIMDDWPYVLGTSTKLSKPLNRYYKRHLSSLFSRCHVVFCISEYMCEEYRKRYGNFNFISLMHSVNEIKSEDNSQNSEEKIIIYAGSLYLERNETIMKLAGALTELKLEGYVIEVYAPQEQWDELKEKFAAFPIIRYGGFVSQDVLEKRIAAAWALTLVESLDEEMLDYTRFSMSTKVPEYLASGKPILVIGHGLQGSIKYIKDNKAGYVATSEEDLPQMVEDFVKLKDFDEIKHNAKQLFEENHKKESQQKMFYNIVTRL